MTDCTEPLRAARISRSQTLWGINYDSALLVCNNTHELCKTPGAEDAVSVGPRGAHRDNREVGRSLFVTPHVVPATAIMLLWGGCLRGSDIDTGKYEARIESVGPVGLRTGVPSEEAQL